MVKEAALVGPPAKIRDDLQALEGTVATTISVLGDLHALPTVIEYRS